MRQPSGFESKVKRSRQCISNMMVLFHSSMGPFDFFRIPTFRFFRIFLFFLPFPVKGQWISLNLDQLFLINMYTIF
jgi:hypothetical protein